MNVYLRSEHEGHRLIGRVDDLGGLPGFVAVAEAVGWYDGEAVYGGTENADGSLGFQFMSDPLGLELILINDAVTRR